jgi:hypothetical protein
MTEVEVRKRALELAVEAYGVRNFNAAELRNEIMWLAEKFLAFLHGEKE